MALSGSRQALMKLFPTQNDPSQYKMRSSDSHSSTCVNQLEQVNCGLTDPWMPFMTSSYEQATAVPGWDNSFHGLPDVANSFDFRQQPATQYAQCPPVMASSEVPIDAQDLSMTSTSDKPSEFSPSASPTSTKSTDYGYRNAEGLLVCSFRGCTSRAVFSRGCDLRKHYKRHNKSHFCSFEGCPQHYEGGFSSKKDLARHEAKHNPGIWCEWEGCNRLFSRVDNMVCVIELMIMNGHYTYVLCVEGPFAKDSS